LPRLAYLYYREAPGASILLLDSHEEYYARRNVIGTGRKLIAPGHVRARGHEDSPEEAREVSGASPDREARQHRDAKFRERLASRPRSSSIRGLRGARTTLQSLNETPYEAFLSRPLSPAARKDLVGLHHEKNYLPRKELGRSIDDWEHS
jgi:hypothetical protein